MAKLTPKQFQEQYKKKVQKANAERKAKDERKSTTPGLFRSIPAQQKQYSTLTPAQQNLQSIIASLSAKGLPNFNLPGSQQNSFEPIRQQALAQFQQQGTPSIAERFQSLGGPGTQGGALSSPELYRQLAEGETNVRNNLNALESQYNLQNSGQKSGNLLNLLGLGLGNQFDYTTMGEQPSLVKRGFQAAAPGLVDAGLSYATGGLSSIGQGLSNRFAGSQNINQPQVNPLYNNYQQALAGQNSSGFTPINNPYSPQAINNSILQGYGQQFNQF